MTRARSDMWKLLLLYIFVNSAAGQNCSENEYRRLLVSCENSCNSFSENCILGAKCVCTRDLFRNAETNLCVEKRYCPFYPAALVRNLVMTVVSTIVTYLLNRIVLNLAPESIIRIFNGVNAITSALSHFKY